MDEFDLCKRDICTLLQTVVSLQFNVTKHDIPPLERIGEQIDALSELVPIVQRAYEAIENRILAVSSETLGSAHREALFVANRLMTTIGLFLYPMFESESDEERRRELRNEWGLWPDANLSAQTPRIAEKIDDIRDLFSGNTTSRICDSWSESLMRRIEVEAAKARVSINSTSSYSKSVIVQDAAVSIDPPQIVIKGNAYALTDDQAAYLKFLIETDERVSDAEFKRTHPVYDTAKLTRWRRSLPAAVSSFLDTNSNGTRWKPLA